MSLLLAELAERRIRLTLPPTQRIPLGLAVPYEQDAARHEVGRYRLPMLPLGTLAVRGDGMEMTIENSPDGHEWSTFLEGTYHRA